MHAKTVKRPCRRHSVDLSGTRREIVALVNSREARGEQGELVTLERRSLRLENERKASIIVVNSRRREFRAQFLSSPNDANNIYIVGWQVEFEFNADGFKRTNPIKINPYRPILRRLISGDLSTDISNIGRFLLQTIWANDFPISYRQQAKNEISVDISANSADI